MKIETDSHFQGFRDNIVGIDLTLDTPLGERVPLTYLDWTASGRGYHPVEKSVLELLGCYANTHSESSFIGRYTSERYHDAHRKVREHVNAGPGDVALFKGQGATGGVNWLQYMLGLRQPIPHENQPIVFITHMEHHSNQTSWEECSAQVIIVKADGQGRPDLNDLSSLCKKYRSEGRQLYGAFTACSNVTGITTNYHEMARILHENEGWCFIDFAASAPYVDINMHPADPLQALDAVYFSPHKFLGGPGSSGVIVFNSALYKACVPVEVGGGIVRWTNPWGAHKFHDAIEIREDAGTPAIIQGIRVALALEVKEAMDTRRIQERKAILLHRALEGLEAIPGVTVLEAGQRDRQGIISFTVKDVHYGLVVTLLSDLFGIQTRGGCSCAGTYGHYLFGIDQPTSKRITAAIDSGDHSAKPGWVRISLHPTMTDQELDQVLYALNEIVAKVDQFRGYYNYETATNSWRLRDDLKLGE